MTTGLSFSYGQTSLSGRVIDQQTRQGIGYVSVGLLHLGDSSLLKGQVSDSTGTFQLSAIPAGNYLLRVMSLGYKTLYQEAVIGARGVQDVGPLFLLTDASLLNGVTIQGERPTLTRMADRLVVQVAGNKLFAAASNTFDILRKVPGLEVSGDGTIQINGRVAPAVFIDGKPLPMSPEEQQAYLSSLTPDMIASIAVINNPSSRYDGEYKGIIDIQLKRDMTLGWQGNLHINSQQNTHHYTESNLLLTYKTAAITYTARLGYAMGDKVYRYHALQRLSNTHIMRTNTPTITAHRNYTYQLGADYRINKDQRLEISLRGYQQNRHIRAFNTLRTTNAADKELLYYSAATTLSHPQQDNYAGNIFYSGLLGNYQLEVLGTYLQVNNQQQEDIQNEDVMKGLPLSYWKTDLRNDVRIRTLQTDMSRPLGSGKLGAGAKFVFSNTRNALRYDTLNKDLFFTLDSGRTNNFHYNEYISAGYLSYEGKYRRWEYAGSVRAEYTRSIADALTTQQRTNRSYITWLPAININYELHPSSQLQLSYSRRITRPTFAQLNPFRFYNSPLNYWVGNPYLQPSVTEMLSISYTQPVFSITVSAGREHDPMARYPEYDPVTHVLEYLGTNLPYNDFGIIEFTLPLTVSRWWRLQHTIRGLYKKELNPYHGTNYAIPITDLTINGSQIFTLPYNITADLTYSYRSQSGNSLYRAMPIGNVDVGLQRSWLKGQLNTKINYYDIFDTYKVRYIFRERQIIDNTLNHWFGNRRLAVTLSYNFGKSTYKAKQAVRNEEEGRIGL
ncbi:TonB-dependent receptor [Chitinophaga pendula]|uniref:TonB-dependent receptor domain-containing protein n=1 Tax=Chitinophaga TaxID=79328 RepID=UPI0018DF6899|nr:MULTISPECIES: TonB-dependent receptor [Chitinophaga]UCJ06016.1 TonB-dependent receptor [Chitinophaga pendula]